jgi:hypothetical protein
MSKKIITEIAILDKLFSMFFNAKAEGTEDKFIANIRKKDPELADYWSKWDKDMESALRSAKRDLKASNLSTDKVDDFLKKNY